MMFALVVLFLNSHSDKARISQRKTDCPVYGNPGWCNGPHGFCVSIKGWGLTLRGRWPLFSESRDAFSPYSLRVFPLSAEQSNTDLLPRVLSFPCPLGL